MFSQPYKTKNKITIVSKPVIISNKRTFETRSQLLKLLLYCNCKSMRYSVLGNILKNVKTLYQFCDADEN